MHRSKLLRVEGRKKKEKETHSFHLDGLNIRENHKWFTISSLLSLVSRLGLTCHIIKTCSITLKGVHSRLVSL